MPDQKPSENQGGETEGTRKPPDDSKPDNLGNNKQPKSRAKKRGKKHRISGNAFRWITLTVEFLALIAVGTYSWFAFQQWKSMNYQIRIANRALHVDQRAWVAQDSVEGKAELGKPFTITVLVKNTGKTFAKNFIGINGWSSKEISDPDPDFNVHIAQGVINASVGLLPPNGGHVTQSLDIPESGRRMTDDDIQNFNNPTKVFFFYGKLTYFDVFNCQHWTTFCYRVFPVSGRYTLYTAYNDADENECP